MRIEDGRVLVRGSTMMRGYLGEASPFDEAGWFASYLVLAPNPTMGFVYGGGEEGAWRRGHPGELHGGTVSAHSEGLGHGTEVAVRLPLDSGAALEASAASGHVARAQRRVLIIEDNVDAADSLSEALEFGDHEVGVSWRS